MSHITCMLCGLQRSLKNYDPTSFDNELYLITKTGKGRAAGWDSHFEPILGDDEYTPVIKNRILEIVRAFKDKKIISEKEMAELTQNPDTSKSFLDEVASRIVVSILTGTDGGNESQVKELSEKVDELKTKNRKLDSDYKKLGQRYAESSVDHINTTLSIILRDYILMHFIKYCDAMIGGSDLSDFKVFLNRFDKDSIPLLACLFEDLSVEEWQLLMDKIQGTPQVQIYMEYSTSVKKSEVDREYNKRHLFDNLQMFRILKHSSLN